MHILGVDLGSVRVGVAVSAPDGTFALPLKVLSFPSVQKLAQELATIIEEQEADCLVFGIPYALGGGETPQTARVRRVIALLKEQLAPLHLRIEEWDERLTTVEAESVLIEADVSRKRRRKSIDALAAALILESWLRAQEERNW